MDPSDRDLAALQGIWEQVGLEADGVVDPPDAHSGPGVLCTFTDATFSVRGLDGAVLLAGVRARCIANAAFDHLDRFNG
ncbi:hypothetical protein BH11MYX1_BH11MYX1_57500 [soil metagenome]